MSNVATMEQIVTALKKCSWRMNTGNGPMVVYPDEITLELFGKEAMQNNFIETSNCRNL